ncbi:unnamed protein product [Calypogeia fissa]
MAGSGLYSGTSTLALAQEGGTQEISGLGGLFERSTNHLSKAHLLFFQQWHRLIDLEARKGFALHSEIWRMPSGK